MNPWGDGEGWEDVPLPPGSSHEDFEDETENWSEEDDTAWYNHPVEPYYPELDTLHLQGGGFPEAASEYLEFLSNLSDIDPSQIRGVAFPSLEDAVTWLQNIGVLSFSSVVEIGGLFYPVIGESSLDSGPTSDDGLLELTDHGWELDLENW